MAKEKNKFVDVVVKLIQLTQEAKLKWHSETPRSSLRTDPENITVANYYITNYKDKRFALYRLRLKKGTQKFPFDFDVFGRKTVPYWESQIVLEIINDKGEVLWQFPEISGLKDLIDSVGYQVAGVDEFLNDILGPEEKK